VLYGVGNGLSWPSYLALLSRAGPTALQGTVQGVGSSAGSFASIIGTLVSGVLIESIGARTLYVAAASLVGATVLFSVAAREPRPESERRP
jgi:MFS transporter, DHA1 family, tetracycline resistance protein